MSLFKPVVTIASAVWFFVANTSIEAPRVGFVRMPNQEVWSLRGIAGTFYFGQRSAASVDLHAFNGAFGVRTSGEHAEFLGVNGEVMRIAKLEGRAMLAGLSTIEETGYVLTPAELWRLTRDRADRFLIDDLLPQDGRIAGISGAGGYIDLAVSSQGQVEVRRIWLETGESVIRETFTGAAEQLSFLPGGDMLWSDYGVLTLRRADGSATQVDAGSRTLALNPMSKGLIHAAGDDGRQYVLQLLADPNGPSMRLLRLPESPQ